MISIERAAQLKSTGLQWEPALHDFFCVPDADMDDRVFIVNDMMAEVETMYGRPTITFHGVVEWALDSVLPVDALWLPTETQLRELLMAQLGTQGQIELLCRAGETICRIETDKGRQWFDGEDASDAYAQALIARLKGL
jgi:hypothetical protein